MSLEDKRIILRVAEHYLRTGSASDDNVKVTCLPVDKTSYVERIGEDDRTILLDEFRVSDRVIWAGYSTRSETVYLSLKSTR
jgi:hypothetical protein